MSHLDRLERYRFEKAMLYFGDSKPDIAEKLSHFRVASTETNLSITIPKDFSVDGVRNLIIDKLIEIELAVEDYHDLERVLVDDNAMMKMFGETYTFRKGTSIETQRAIIRAEIYGNNYSCDPRFELMPGDFRADSRRPVLMRGSKEAMQSKYTTKSGMAEKIAERYLRFIKFTCFTKTDPHWDDTIFHLRTRLRENDWYIHNNLQIELHPSEVWINGEKRRAEDDDVKAIIALSNDHASRAVIRANKEREAEETWRRWQEEKIRQKNAKNEQLQKQRQINLQLRRKRRAEQIAAYELLSELQMNRGSNAKS